MRTFLISGIFIIFILVQLFRGADAKRIIDGDGSGHYAYLTALFVHNTTDFTPVLEYEKSRRGLDYMGHYFHPYEDVLVNKYYLGTALLMLPFFLLAFLYSFVIGMPVDGYNFLFQHAVALGAATYASLGMVLINKLLQSFNISKKLSLFTILMLLFGTNLFHYTFFKPSFSHVYSFATIALFLLASRRLFLYQTKRSFYVAVFAFALACLIRPANGLIIFALPFVAANAQRLKDTFQFLLGHPRIIFSGLLLFAVVFGLQPFFYYLQTGKFMLWAYHNEGFYFLRPAMFDFLFSYRKGFFVYTPMMLLLIPAAWVLWKHSRYLLLTFGGFFLLLVYVFSSWWNWFYGDSFGMRPMVDFYALFSIPFALLLKQIEGRRMFIWLLATFASLAVFLNLFQTFQYYKGIIHPDSMTKAKYWHVFLKTGEGYSNIFGAFPELYYGSLDEHEKLSFFLDMEQRADPWSFTGIRLAYDAYSGKQVSQMNGQLEYSPTLVLENQFLRETKNPVYIKAQVSYREFEPNNAHDALLVYAATNRANVLIFYKTFRLKQMPDFRVGVWRKADFGFAVPSWTTDLNQVKIYIWNRGKKEFQIDDFKVDLYFAD